MADDTKEIPMTTDERMDNARNVLVVEAADYLSRGYIPNSGRGTVGTDDDGTQRIVGINDDQFSSTINWQGKAIRTTDGAKPNLQLVDKTDFGGRASSYMERRQLVDFHDPSTIKDNLKIISGDKVKFEMDGTCKITDKGSDCNYTIKSDDANGTVHVTTNKVDNLTARTTAYDSTIHVKTTEVDMSAAMKFYVARDTATYEYKRLGN